jgi:23S rRNA (uracil1939-C5)-methyltransferase
VERGDDASETGNGASRVRIDMNRQPSHQKNEDVMLVIDGMNHEGLGVARLDGMAVFVQGALKGETVKAHLIKVASTYAVARVLDVVEASPERQEPFCPVFRRCGGCSLQHMSYTETLRFKHQVVLDSLERLGGFKGIEVKPVLGMDHPFRYRNKAQYPVGLIGTKPIAGFYSRRSHDIVDASACGIQHPSSELLRAAVMSWIVENKVPIYSEETGKGLVRHIVARIGMRTGEAMVMLVATKNRIPAAEKLVNRLRKQVPGITGIVLNVNDAPGNIVLGEENYILFGSPIIEDKLCDMTFEISPMSFYQVNPDQTEILYRKAMDCAALSGTEIVFDLYCGIGTLSLVAARKAGRVIGVEAVEEAVETARENARKNRMGNVEFHLGNAEDVVPKLYEAGIHADVVIVDPPRKGCDHVLLETILAMQPDRIVYVSCNPSTLARDLKVLCGSGVKATVTDIAAEPEMNAEKADSDVKISCTGYRIESVQPVDMFPWTEHVETVTLITRLEEQGFVKPSI